VHSLTDSGPRAVKGKCSEQFTELLTVLVTSATLTGLIRCVLTLLIADAGAAGAENHGPAEP
jgi:hypothetical protein